MLPLFIRIFLDHAAYICAYVICHVFEYIICTCMHALHAYYVATCNFGKSTLWVLG